MEVHSSQLLYETLCGLPLSSATHRINSLRSKDRESEFERRLCKSQTLLLPDAPDTPGTPDIYADHASHNTNLLEIYDQLFHDTDYITNITDITHTTTWPQAYQ